MPININLQDGMLVRITRRDWPSYFDKLVTIKSIVAPEYDNVKRWYAFYPIDETRLMHCPIWKECADLVALPGDWKVRKGQVNYLIDNVKSSIPESPETLKALKLLKIAYTVDSPTIIIDKPYLELPEEMTLPLSCCQPISEVKDGWFRLGLHFETPTDSVRSEELLQAIKKDMYELILRKK